jgi:CspA family cold shock protein
MRLRHVSRHSFKTPCQEDTSSAHGTVRWFNDQKGYGFIGQDEGGDVFVHHCAIEGGGFRSLNERELVEFDAVPGPIRTPGESREKTHHGHVRSLSSAASSALHPHRAEEASGGIDSAARPCACAAFFMSLPQGSRSVTAHYGRDRNPWPSLEPHGR